MVYDHVPSYDSIHPSSTYWYWVLAWVICCFYGDCPCTIIWKHTSIIHTLSHIMVLGLDLGHMLFLWCMTNDHVPSYASIPPSSILIHTYWYWVLAWVICCFYGDWPYVYMYVHSAHMYICIVYMYRYISYICIYTQYPIPNKKIPHQKIPFLLKARHYP